MTLTVIILLAKCRDFSATTTTDCPSYTQLALSSPLFLLSPLATFLALSAVIPSTDAGTGNSDLHGSNRLKPVQPTEYLGHRRATGDDVTAAGCLVGLSASRRRVARGW